MGATGGWSWARAEVTPRSASGRRSLAYGFMNITNVIDDGHIFFMAQRWVLYGLVKWNFLLLIKVVYNIRVR
jgi:hypothetical protein